MQHNRRMEASSDDIAKPLEQTFSSIVTPFQLSANRGLCLVYHADVGDTCQHRWHPGSLHRARTPEKG